MEFYLRTCAAKFSYVRKFSSTRLQLKFTWVATL